MNTVQLRRYTQSLYNAAAVCDREAAKYRRNGDKLCDAAEVLTRLAKLVEQDS